MRRILPQGRTWDQLDREFVWPTPAFFSIAERCCDSWAKDDPDRVALIDASDGDKNWTYGALKDASDRLARVFGDHGIGVGDVVGVILPQGPAVMAAHFAAYKLGAVVLPLFSLFGPDALAYRLSDSACKLVVTDSDSAQTVGAIRDKLPGLATVMTVGPAFWADIAAARPIAAPYPTRAEDPAVLIYTSGTTGAPKGVLHAHRFLLGHLPSIELTHRGFPQPGDCGWTPADWAWIGGLMDLAMPCLYYGVPLVSLRMRKFDAAAAWALIARLRVRNLFLPPTALKLMRQVPVPGDVAVRSITSGGEALGAELLDWARGALGVEISEIYGQTECNLVAASVPGVMNARPGALGRAVPGFTLSLRDEDGGEVDVGAVGEICVRGGPPDMMLKYLGKPDETAKKFRDGWLRTGDLAVAGADGLLAFVARDDDVITSSGYRIGPAEIEACLGAHPDVVMAGVVGMPDPERTEIVVAHVVLRDGVARDGLQQVLRAWVAERVSPHVAPRRVVWSDGLPMTATGKILRRALREVT